MGVQLSPMAVQRFYDNNNNPLVGGQLFTYQAGTNTPSPTYTDSTGVTQNTNPVVLNARGEAFVWMLPTQAYKLILCDAAGNTIWTCDHVVAPAPVAVGNMTDEKGSGGQPGFVAGVDFTPGATTSLTLSTNYGSAANLWVAFDGTEQGADTYSLSGTTLTFNAAIPSGVNKVYAKGGTALTVGTPGNATVTDGSVSPSAGINSSKLSFLQGSGGSIARTVQSKLQDILSVRDFGATGNGTTDDTAAFNLAIAVATALGGARVFVPAGTYLVSSTIVLAANVIIEGDGKYASSITVPNTATGFAGYTPNAVFMLNASNCGIRHLGMNGNIANNSTGSFGAIANTVAVSNIFVTDCYIHDFIYNGIILNPATSVLSGFDISRNVLQNIGWGGIAAYCSINGRINENSITSCGATGILTGYNSNTGNYNVAQRITIDGNYVTKASAPTHIVSGAAETGFMIAVGAGDSYITVSNNVCFDNRNAAQDGIGLGQDGVRVNEGLVFDSNVVTYAGLYGIDVSSNHIVSGNYIRYSAQQGIKLGTDVGGNLVNATVVDNIIDSCNFAGAGSNQGIWVNATLTGGIPTALYENIKINGNRVMDFNGSPHTIYGLGIGFQSGLTYQNCEFNSNDFTQLTGSNGAGVTWSGPIPSFTGWDYKGNKHPNALPVISGATPVVLGLDAAAISQSGATNLSALSGVFSGQEITFQMADGNTTWVPGGNILTHSGASLGAASNSIWKLFCYGTGCYLNQFFTP